MCVQLVGDPLDRTSPAERVLAGLDRQTRRTLTQLVGVSTGSSHDRHPPGVFDVSIKPGRFRLKILERSNRDSGAYLNDLPQAA